MKTPHKIKAWAVVDGKKIIEVSLYSRRLEERYPFSLASKRLKLERITILKK